MRSFAQLKRGLELAIFLEDGVGFQDLAPHFGALSLQL